MCDIYCVYKQSRSCQLLFVPALYSTYITLAFIILGLDEEVGDRHLAIIARDHVTDWEDLCPFLDLSREQEIAIRSSFNNDYGKQKHECLEVWKEMKGKKATYSAFINAATDAQFLILANRVEDMLKKQQTAPPPHSKGK